MGAGRLLHGLQSALWLLLLAAGWLLALATGWGVWAAQCCGFAAASPAAWRHLAAAFESGGALRFDFVMTLLAAASLGVAGLIWLAWRWPILAMSCPDLVDPVFALAAALSRRRAARRHRATAAPRQPALVPPAPAAAAAPVGASPASPPDDSAVARLLALAEIWQTPPAAWMQDALRDEVRTLPDDAWTTLERLAEDALPVLTLLQDQGLVPDRPDIGAMIARLTAACPAEAGLGPVAAAPPSLTLGAAWLCELIESHLLQGPDKPLATPEDLGIDGLLVRALRGMTEADWASLDRFPDRARRIRVLSDQLQEDLRRIGSPVDLINRLLQHYGFGRLLPSDKAPAGEVLATRGELLLLLSLVPGNLRAWPQSGNDLTADPHYRAFWQRLALVRLRHPARRVAGLLVLPKDLALDHAALARRGEAQRSRTGIALACLEDRDGALPSLSTALADLSASPQRLRPAAAAAARAALQP